MALAALRGQTVPEVGQALGVAHRFLAECHSADALNWLRLGLLAQGGLPAGFTPPEVVRRTVPELSLSLLLEQGEAARRFFWEEA
jgi:hypothetical protein